MSCVNKSSKEFKQLAANNNIDSNTLELIVHKYWLETGSEKNFPTDVYIQAQLGSGQYKETIPEVIKLWKRDYSHPMTYVSLQEVKRAYDKALLYFPPEAVYYNKDANGKYTLTVKEPVSKVTATASSFFENEAGVRKLDLGLDSKIPYTVDKAEELFNKFNTDRTTKFLADKVFSIAKELGIKVSFDESLPIGKVGRYTNNNTIVYKRSFFENDANASKKAPILLHEIIHAVSMYALSEQTADWKRPELIEKFRAEVNDVFNSVKSHEALKGERGIKDIMEFVAELSNPIFRQKLQSIDNRKWYTKILDAIKSFFGIHTSSTYYNRMMNALDGALEAFDIDGYMEYNGMKSQLQQAYNEHRVDFEEMSESELKTMLKDAIKEKDASLNNKDVQQTAKDYINGKYRFNNLTEKENDIARRDELLAGAEVASRIHESSSRKESQDERNERQEEQVTQWAKKVGVWHEDALAFGKSFGEEVPGGQESHVYINEKNKSVVKVKSTIQYHDLQEFLDGIVLNNLLFPQTAYKILGFGDDGEGFVAILEQPFAVGEEPTQKQIDDYVKENFPDAIKYEESLGNGRYFTDHTFLHDISPRNAIITAKGNIAVIDAIIRPNTASEGKGGKRSDDYGISDNASASFIDSMSKDQLISELKQIKQEYADYDLIQEEPPTPPKKSTFKFNDGTEIKVPFTPNDQQAEALNVMNDFIHSNENIMTLSGYAGTGKTSLMEIIAQKASRDGKQIAFSASTNKAAAVLDSKVHKYGFKAVTLNKIFGIGVEVDQSKSYDAKNLVTTLKDAQVMPDSVVVIDEASMINKKNYDILKGIAKQWNLKLIFVGDRAQLAPVKENKVSIVFRNNDGKVIELTKVERTDDNAVLKESTRIRNGEHMSMQSSFNKEGKGVAFINPKGEHRDDITATMEHLIPGLKKDSEYFRILAYTNKAVEQYNNWVRKKLGYGTVPEVGEPIMGYTNWGYNGKTKPYKFINSESYKIMHVDSPVTKSITVGNQRVNMTATPITIQDSLGKVSTVNFMDIKSNEANRQAAVLLASMKKRLWEEVRHASNARKRAIHQQIDDIDDFLFVNDNIIDEQGDCLQKKTFDFGYALTVHKSQGSTFKHVLLDAQDIAKASSTEDTGISSDAGIGEEAYNDPETATMTGAEDLDFDFGFDDSTATETSSQTYKSDDAANIRQQLEYVGMSRATDTVTVITPEAQKEDSILNHLKEKGADKPIVEEERPEVPTAPTVQSYTGDIAPDANTVFVFGSNPEGRHGAGAAKVAREKFGAIYGQGEGLQGNAYALPTKDLRVKENNSLRSISEDKIVDSIKKLYETARQNPDKQFKVAYRNTDKASLNGYTGLEMIEMFIKAGEIPSNIVFSKEWADTGKFDTINQTNDTFNNQNLKQQSNEQQATDSRGVVQSAVPGNIQIQWGQEVRRDGSSSSQEAQAGRGTDTTGVRRHGDDVAKQVSDASDALDKKLADKGIKATKQKVRKAESQEFHDAIAEAKKQNSNGWMVDVHETSDYDNDLCMLTEDGKAGIAVTKDGDIISVFSAVKKDHRLDKLMQMAIAAGGKKLDCYYLNVNGVQTGLPLLYAHFGFKVESTTPFDAQYAPEEYAEWQKNNPDKTVEGVAAMSLKVEDAIESYSLDNTPDLEKAPSFTDYDEMLEYRDSHKINLPGYTYFTESNDGVTVDSAWKIPKLKELDAELSSENTTDDNNEILNKMNDILKATSEEEVQGKHSNEKESNIQNGLKEYVKLNTQFDNLLEGRFSKEFQAEYGATDLKGMDIKFTASELRHVAELAGDYFSDIITKLQTEKDAWKEMFPYLVFAHEPDFTKMTRLQIVDKIGMQNLVNYLHDVFDSESSHYYGFDNTDTMLKADLLTDNWDAFMLLASDTISLNEGFGLTRDYDHSKFDLNKETKVDYDDFNGYQDEDSIREEEGDEQEHWQIESRTIDVLNSMSALVRQGLHECYILDSDGNKVLDEDWNMPLRVNPRKATNSILRWVQGTLTLEDMVNRLRDKQESNPWVSQLISRLTDTTGKESDFQSQFFGVFMKHFQLYNIVQDVDGKYVSMPVNNRPALGEAFNSITAQFRMGEHPLFAANGKINAKLLGNENTTGDNEEFNLAQAHAKLEQIGDSIVNTNSVSGAKGTAVDPEILKNSAKWIAGSFRVLGYPVTEEMVMESVNNTETYKWVVTRIGYIVRDLNKELENQRNGGNIHYDPFAFYGKNNIAGTLRNLLTPITESLEDVAISSFYDSGKMYQSYVTPSYMTKLMQKFKLEGQEFRDFLEQEYGNSEWFKDKDGHWRLDMLNILSRWNKGNGNIFDFKVELNFNKHNYMRNMSDSEYTLSLFAEYFAEGWNSKIQDTAWYRMPMQSNKPSSEFYKFVSYRGDTYKKSITNSLYKMFLQELSRIQTVNMRGLGKKDAGFIKNFDTNGKKFNFLPFLNAYLKEGNKAGRTLLRNADNTVSADNEKLASLIQRKIEGLEETKLSADEEAALVTLTQQAINNHMEERVAQIMDNWEKNGIIEAARSVKNIVMEDTFLYNDRKENDPERNRYVKESLENFLWNDYLAAKSILQLTVGDIAFYKDVEDLQKRLAQLHAPGIRGNVRAIDYEGKRVSDGTYRTFILKDWDDFISNVVDNIAEIFDRKIAAAPENQKAAMRALKESLVGENGAYRKINVADAQGFSSPSSYRKKALMFGKWSKDAEGLYQDLRKNYKKIINGEYTYTDLKNAFQPLKPFVYSHLKKDMGVANAPITSMNVPFQAKNSEYLLIMADALMKSDAAQGNKLSRPNLLKAVYRIMEESERLNPTKGIDTVQFESAIKSSLQGALDLHQYADMAGGEEAAYSLLMNSIYKKGADGKLTSEYNTKDYVHEAPFEDYCLQQEVPEHFRDHSQAHGSQERMIIPSDLDMYIDDNADHNDPANINYYEWTEPDGTKKRLKADEFRKEYEETIAANIEADIDKLYQEFNLFSEDKRERNLRLSHILQREILSSPRYGVDLLQACAVDKDGNFRIPKSDPIQAKRIEQLLNSIIKNRINKQKIAGGPIVQVSNFGTSKQLNIRFYDKQGGILKTKAEFEANPVEGYSSYEEYTKANQAGVAYFEVFIPIWSKDLYEKFADENGNIDVAAMKECCPELMRMVSYRIPTEDKYSIAPMKAVGFMPREAGDGIMLPYDLTTVDDSDFDVDKRYVMRKVGTIKQRSAKAIKDAMFEKISSSFKSQGKNYKDNYLKEIIDLYYSKKQGDKINEQELIANANRFMGYSTKIKNVDSLMKYFDSVYRKVAYYTSMPTKGKDYRNNKIIDMTLAVLNNEKSADKLLNPGGFENVAKVGYQIAAYRSAQAADRGLTWEQLSAMSEDELKEISYTSKDLAWADTQIQFYKQNAATSSMIGIFAVSKIAHATLESNGIYLNVDKAATPFTIAGMEFSGRMEIDPKFDKEGNLIGKTAGSLVSASADGVKKPVLELMNISPSTSGVLNTMLRLGMPFQDAALFMSQDVITRMLKEFNNRNLTNYASLDSLIGEYLAKYVEKHGLADTNKLDGEELSRTELIEGLRSSEHQQIDYKVINTLQKLMKLNKDMKNPTFATRFNSINSAVGPLIIDNLILEHKIQQFRDSNQDSDSAHFTDAQGYVVDIDHILDKHPILKQFSRAIDAANIIFSDMAVGSKTFKRVLNAMPSNLSDKVFGDRKLLSQLSDFFQSYVLVASGLVDSTQLKYYIEKFPKEFINNKYKEKYADNALIQAINPNTNRKSNNAFLEIKITGMDTSQKEELSNAWVDLHKEDPELSTKLFVYNFFRAGIGFSPKTFISLVPLYVKEHLTNDNATYVDTYRDLPDISAGNVIDQFVRNNWNNTKLVPWKGGKDTKYSFDYDAGTVTITGDADIASLDGTAYFKSQSNKGTRMWKFYKASEDGKTLTYKEVKPLGNNGEYLEISSNEIKGALTKTTKAEADNSPAALKEQSPVEEATAATPNTMDKKQEQSNVDKMVDIIWEQMQSFNPNTSRAAATSRFLEVEESRKAEDAYTKKKFGKFIMNALKRSGITLDPDAALEEFDKYC